MAKRFTAIIIIANFIMGSLLYLSSQAMLLHLASTHPVLTLTGVNIDKIYIGAVQAPSSPTPLVITTYPNLPFYVLWLPLIVNAYIIVKVSRSSAVAKRFPLIIIIANIMTSLLTYFSIETTLLSLVGAEGNYTRIGGVNFWSYGSGAAQVGSSAIPLVVTLAPNLSSYAFLLFAIVNACFIIKLLRSKDK
jgi:hypothetical protein